MGVRTLLLPVATLLLTACGKAPFDQHELAACDNDARALKLTLVDAAAGDGIRLAMACRPGSGHELVVVGARPDGVNVLARRSVDEPVVSITSGLSDASSSLLVAFDGGTERWIDRVSLDDGMGEPERVYETGFSLRRLVVSDVDGDGRRDVVIPETDTWLRTIDDSGAAWQREQIADDLDYRNVNGDVADINGDGVLDGVYRLPGEGLIRLYCRDSVEDVVAGNAMEQITGVLGGGDFNGDGTTDLVVATGGMPEARQVAILLSEGDGEWVLTDDIPSLVDTAQVVARDFDGDGQQDILAAPMASPDVDDYDLVYLQGRGDGSFSDGGRVSMPDYPYELIALPGSAPMAPAVIVNVGESGRIAWLTPSNAGK